MEKALGALLIATGLVTSAPALSQETPDTAIYLVWLCEGKEPADAPNFGILHCASYLSGMMDMNAMVTGTIGQGFFCLPERGISNDQARRVFLEWAARNSGSLHESKRSTVVSALNEAFPCD